MDKWFRLGFLTGLLVGAAVGLVTAPSGGSATRCKIRRVVEPSFVRLSGLRVRLGAIAPPDLDSIKQAI